ncbi:unnamed protein product, partial [Ectocarpus sp. 12 AP-2014]
NSATAGGKNGSGRVLDKRPRPAAVAAAAAAASLDKDNEKENRAASSSSLSASPPAVTDKRPSSSSSQAPGAATVAAVPTDSNSNMSGFYLEGPAPPAKSGVGEGGGGGNWNLPPARYSLPLGEIVVGRDSVRDASPANCNKLRIGIDKREEGVSRSQAIVQVCPLEGRLQVTHKQGAINGIRIIRWKGSPGLTSAQRAELRIGAPGAARSLRAGEILQ